MADNTAQNGTDILSTDDLGGVKVQRVKVQYGVDGTALDVSHVNPLPMGVIRKDADGATGADYDQQQLHVNSLGRLKVSTLPGDYDAITGSISAVQAAVGTPVANATVVADVSRASNINIYCTGTFSAVNCTFEGSIEATGENWFTIQGVRTNANTVETTTGSLSAAPAYAWELSVNALKRFRVRATARTSGTQNWTILPGAYATEPIPATQITGTQPVSGTVTASAAAASTGTWLFAKYEGLTTTVQTVKTGATNFGGYFIHNPNTTTAYLQVFNVATGTTVTPGTTAPSVTFGIPAGASANLEIANGLALTLGCKVIATTTASGGSAPATGLDVNIWYR